MESGNFVFIGVTDTLTHSQGVIQIKAPVKISLDPLGSPSSERIHTLDENKIFHQPEKPKKRITVRSKSQQDQFVLKDTTIQSGLSSDYILQQITVIPKGIELPSSPSNYRSADWFTFVLFFSLVLFVSAKRTSEKYIPLLFRSITNYSLSSKLFREQNISFMQGSAIMEIFYILVLGLFCFQLLKYFDLNTPFSGFVSFMIILGILVIFFLVKLLLYRSLGFISETLSDTNEYLFNMKNHNKVLGIFLLPVVCFTAWYPAHNPRIFLITGLVLVSVFYLFYLGRGMKILIKKHYSIFYLFLYLCTLEILPLLLLIKII
jgi:hypothetical protein